MFISSLTISAWLVKPLIGYVIDNVFDKKAWIFIALVFDIFLALLLGFAKLPLIILITALVLNSTNTAFRDVAVDGVMCVEGKKFGITGKIQSVQWISINVAALLTGIGGGVIAEKWGYQAAFLCLIPVYLAVGVIAFFFVEDKAGNNNSSRLFQDLKKLFTDKRLLIIGLFIFLYKYSPSFGTPLFFIQRDTFKWGKVWIGTLGSISTVFGIIGSLLYYKFSQKINLTRWLFISVFVGAVATLSYLYYTPVTAVAYDVVYSFMGMFIFLMIMDFMARNTVKGLEATSFALLASISNLALVASNLSGAFLLKEGIPLTWLIVISSLTSFLCLPLISRIK